MGVGEPEQAQEPNEDDLAEKGIAVDQEGNRTTNKGGFDQIKNRHNALLRFIVGIRGLRACTVEEAAVCPGATTITP